MNDFCNKCVQKLNSQKGLCTSIANSDAENVVVIKLILDAYLAGQKLEQSLRVNDSWWHDDLLPLNFQNKFRVMSDRNVQLLHK